jgi:hypothetical protein
MHERIYESLLSASSYECEWPSSFQPAYIIQPHPHHTQFDHDGDSTFLQNVGVHLQGYTVSQHWKPQSKLSLCYDLFCSLVMSVLLFINHLFLRASRKEYNCLNWYIYQSVAYRVSKILCLSVIVCKKLVFVSLYCTVCIFLLQIYELDSTKTLIIIEMLATNNLLIAVMHLLYESYLQNWIVEVYIF